MLVLHQYRHPAGDAVRRAAGRPARRRGRGPARGGAGASSARRRCCSRRALDAPVHDVLLPGAVQREDRATTWPRTSSRGAGPRRLRAGPRGGRHDHSSGCRSTSLLEGVRDRPDHRRPDRPGAARATRCATAEAAYRRVRRPPVRGVAHVIHSGASATTEWRSPSERNPASMKVGVPKEVKNHEYRVALTPIGVHELVQHGHEVLRRGGRGRRLVDPRRGVRRRGRHDAARRRRRLGHRRHGPQGQGAGRRGVRPAARGADPLHLPAPRRRPAADRRARRTRRVTVDRLRDGAAALRLAAAALPDVRGRRLPGAAGRARTR